MVSKTKAFSRNLIKKVEKEYLDPIIESIRADIPQIANVLNKQFANDLVNALEFTSIGNDGLGSPLSYRGILGIDKSHTIGKIKADLVTAMNQSRIYRYSLRKNRSSFTFSFTYGQSDYLRDMAKHTMNLDWVEGLRGTRKDAGEPWLLALIQGIINEGYEPIDITDVSGRARRRSRSKEAIQEPAANPNDIYKLAPVNLIKLLKEFSNVAPKYRKLFEDIISNKVKSRIKDLTRGQR